MGGAVETIEIQLEMKLEISDTDDVSGSVLMVRLHDFSRSRQPRHLGADAFKENHKV